MKYRNRGVNSKNYSRFPRTDYLEERHLRFSIVMGEKWLWFKGLAPQLRQYTIMIIGLRRMEWYDSTSRQVDSIAMHSQQQTGYVNG